MIVALRAHADRILVASTPLIIRTRGRFARWFAARSRREQRLIQALGIVAAIVVLVFAIVRPLQAARAQALADIGHYRALDARLRAAGPLIGQGGQRTGTLATAIPEAAQSAGLSIQRIEPDADGVRVTLDDVPFDVVAGWLAQLDAEDGVAVSEIKIDRQTAPGHVDVQALLVR